MSFAYLMFLTALVVAAWLALESSLASRMGRWSRVPPGLVGSVAMMYFFALMLFFVLWMIQLGGIQTAAASPGNPHCMGLPVKVC